MSELHEQIVHLFQTAEEPFNAVWKWAKTPDDPGRRADRFAALEKWAGEHKRNEDHDGDEWRSWRSRQRVYRKRRKANEGQDTANDVPGVEDGGWHPDAIRVQTFTTGPFLSGPPRLVWHTTEGYGLPTYDGSQPHITTDPRTGRLWQHGSIKQWAMALKNLSGGVETNKDGAIQVEIIEFAARSPHWPDYYYDHLADLARWIEKYAGVKRACGVTFAPYPGTPHRMSMSEWGAYSGHCGHQHVPENDHGDPGAFRIKEVLN